MVVSVLIGLDEVVFVDEAATINTLLNTRAVDLAFCVVKFFKKKTKNRSVRISLYYVSFPNRTLSSPSTACPAVCCCISCVFSFSARFRRIKDELFHFARPAKCGNVRL